MPDAPRPARPAAPAGTRGRARPEPSGVAAARLTIPMCLVLASLLPAMALVAFALPATSPAKPDGPLLPGLMLALGLLAAVAAGVLINRVARHYRR